MIFLFSIKSLVSYGGSDRPLEICGCTPVTVLIYRVFIERVSTLVEELLYMGLVVPVDLDWCRSVCNLGFFIEVQYFTENVCTNCVINSLSSLRRGIRWEKLTTNTCYDYLTRQLQFVDVVYST